MTNYLKMMKHHKASFGPRKGKIIYKVLHTQ